MSGERRELTVEQARSILRVRDDTAHTFVDGGLALIGASWPLARAEELITGAASRELAGGGAASMGHGLAVWGVEGNRRSVVFFETIARDEWGPEIDP